MKILILTLFITFAFIAYCIKAINELINDTPNTFRLPNFLVLGVPKSATTWLHCCLMEHPEIFTAKTKEIEFFNRHFSFNKYKKHFTGWNKEKVGGEVSINNFQSLTAPKKIAEALDKDSVKLIVMLREPISRALSHYGNMLAKGRAARTFNEAIHSPHFYDHWVEKGHYDIYYENYLKYFRKDQIHIVLFENIKVDPLLELRKVFRFLGVNEDFRSDVFSKKINTQRAIRNLDVLYFFQRTATFFGKVLPRGGKVAYKTFMLLNKILNTTNAKLEVFIPNDLLKELQKKFTKSNERLAELSGLDLTSWKYTEKCPKCNGLRLTKGRFSYEVCECVKEDL